MRARLALACLLLAAARPAVADEFKVVVHPDNPATELPRSQVSRLFLKKATRWPAGLPVRPVEPASPRLRERFARAVHDRSLDAVTSYWYQQIFSGRDVPPLEKASEAEVVAYVRDNPGAIGYVGPGAETAGVKVLSVVPDPP